jgi:VanZ family protein
MSTKQYRWALLLAWMGAIFYVSGTPSNEIPDFGGADLLVKKGAHALAYAILGILAYRASGSRWVALLIAVLYAISDETHQLFVVGRNGQPLDVVIDAVGAVVGLWGYGVATRPRSPTDSP